MIGTTGAGLPDQRGSLFDTREMIGATSSQP
jgi:hypothetical protein